MPNGGTKRGASAVKEEPTSSKPLCIQGLEGKDLTNKLEYTLRSTPNHIKQHYEENLKKAKTSTTQEKQEFIQKLFELKSKGWKDPYFEKFKKVTTSTSTGSSSAWISWQQVLTKENVATATLMLKQKKLLSRPHADLDHEDEETKELEWFDRHQFKYRIEEGEEKTTTETSASAKEKVDGEEDGIKKEEKEEEEPGILPEAKSKKIVAAARRSRALWLANDGVFAGRIKKFEGNEYPWVLFILVVLIVCWSDYSLGGWFLIYGFVY